MAGGTAGSISTKAAGEAGASLISDAKCAFWCSGEYLMRQTLKDVQEAAKPGGPLATLAHAHAL